MPLRAPKPRQPPPRHRKVAEMNFNPETDCYDCGDAPAWQFATGKKCRACHTKGGERDYVEIDPDKLVSLLGKDFALRVIRECAKQW